MAGARGQLLIIEIPRRSIRDDGSLARVKARDLQLAIAMGLAEIDRRKTALSVSIVRVRDNACSPVERRLGIAMEANGDEDGELKRNADAGRNALQPLLFKPPRVTVVVISFLSSFRDHSDPTELLASAKKSQHSG